MQAAKSRSRVQGAIGEDFIAMFVLVRSVRIPRAFDPAAIMAEAERLARGQAAMLVGFDLLLSLFVSGLVGVLLE